MPTRSKGRRNIMRDKLNQKDRDWFKVRKYAINRWRYDKMAKSRIAAILGVSRQAVHNWIKRWKKYKCWEALRDKPSRPQRVNHKKPALKDRIIKYRQAHPYQGAQKIQAQLGLVGILSHQSIQEILWEAGLAPRGKKKRRKWKHFARHHSNSLWQMDFKEMEMKGQKRYLFTILDDHSRFILACRVLKGATTKAVLDVLRHAIRMFGLPRQILTDHGTQFWSARGGLSGFDMCCEKLGIRHIMAGVKKPTTIGKVERWHRTVMDEFGGRCSEWNAFEEGLPDYLAWYNCERLHWGTDLATPMATYIGGFISEEDIFGLSGVNEVY